MVLPLFYILFHCVKRRTFLIRNRCRGSRKNRGQTSMYRKFSKQTPCSRGNVQPEEAWVHMRTKPAAFSTDWKKSTPLTASAAMTEAKISPVPGRDSPAMCIRAAAAAITVEAVAARAVAAIRKLFRSLFYRNEIHKIIAVLHACYHDFVRPPWSGASP